MERVAFFLEHSGERLGCLLNPEGLEVRRLAGVRPRRSEGGPITGSRLSDDPLLYTGGGTTELRLDLLFDVSLAGSSIQPEDVRDLTAPFWRLAENNPGEDGYGRPPVVRFVWGKSWNVPGIVTAVAERLESFSPRGAPRRSWLRMRLLRVSEAEARRRAAEPTRRRPEPLGNGRGPAAGAFDVHEVLGGVGDRTGPQGGGGERLDLIASRYYGDPSAWRMLASANNVEDPRRVPSGTLLRVPSRSAPGGER